MGRSKWKGPFISEKHLKEIIKLKKQGNNKKPFIIGRDSEIVPTFIGMSFKVHNGKNYSEILVNESMVGHKFGEFSFTRKKFLFKKKKTKK